MTHDDFLSVQSESHTMTIPENALEILYTIRGKLNERINAKDVVTGEPDPQEWLVGREVEIDFSSWKDNFDEDAINDSPGIKTFDMLSGKEKRELARQSNSATLAAHLLYWSTLYTIKTQGQHLKEFFRLAGFSSKGETHQI